MSGPIDSRQLPPIAQKVLSPDAPMPMRQMAARGVLPGAKPADVVTVVALLADQTDETISSLAKQTLAKLPPPVLEAALAQNLDAAVLERLSGAFSDQADVVERLLRQESLGQSALELLAERADERIGELIATNEQRMLMFPTVIEKLYLNKRVRMSTADRLIDLAVRNGLELKIPAFKEAASAIQNELIPEPSDERNFDDELFAETDAIAASTELDLSSEDTHEIDDEGEEKLREKFLPLHTRIAQMTISQRIRCATLGTSAERLLLVRDPNRLVSSAAAKSPLIKESEVVCLTASRSVSDEVLRIFASNRDFTRNYQVKLNLVSNPRTPFTFVARLIPHLRDSDLRTLAKSKNVTGTVATSAQQQLDRKKSPN
ncbi:MAG TPA: hypothetical protein VKP30_11005 [Polyangiaceae bacterium]|nr:hypothetical protein [Polyangiaceae bacterium]